MRLSGAAPASAAWIWRAVLEDRVWSGGLGAERFDGPKRVVAGDDQNHMRRVERVLGREQQCFAFGGVADAVDFEYRAAVLEADFVSPSGERGVRLRPSDEDDVVLAQE